MQTPDPLVQALIGYIDSIFEGPNGDYSALLESLVGVTVAQALWKPAPDANSIWQIVDHLRASKMWQIEMLEKGEAASPDWIQPIGDERTWQKAVILLKETHTRLKISIGQLSGQFLLSTPSPEMKQTLLQLILSIAAHEAHHGGQIDYLKGLQAGAARK